MTYPELSKVEAVRSELQRRIADGKQAETELGRLEEWLKTGESLFSALKSGVRTENPEIRIRAIGKQNPLSSVAEEVLKRAGRLHINALIDHMKKQGWVSTGDQRLDMKNVFSVLSRSKHFTNVGRNTWDLSVRTKAEK